MVAHSMHSSLHGNPTYLSPPHEILIMPISRLILYAHVLLTGILITWILLLILHTRLLTGILITPISSLILCTRLLLMGILITRISSLILRIHLLTVILIKLIPSLILCTRLLMRMLIM